ncbi:putative ubiquitin carboxyl-terminal hydrolase protein [Botrytis fragariae]|uniref:Ubiquitin carboxyl-terminal hydrolase n=1 Tax=Botrytis fragariae TaxID=1964551 RepID=A0A8H6ASW1_9HELO|nr:putative ubiquitin carboxyl-terminal hydrolase protein [Botrytis fragariae]KAF5872815.1 putative ubiquitin carboxyl-terminal hydrolase protein [Botrytis fragariae]
MNLDDPKDKVINIKMELDFEGSPKETQVSSDSELEDLPTRKLVSRLSEPGGFSKAELIFPDTRDIDPGASLNLTSQMILRPSGARMINNRLTFTKFENKSKVMNALAIKLGLSPALKFYDVCSFTGTDSFKNIPRPVYALLFSIPFTSTWESMTRAKEMAKLPYKGSGPDQPVIWFKQAIAGACGSMGLLHCLLNGQAHRYVLPDTVLSRLYEQSIPLGPDDRATMLYNDQKFEDAHQAIAILADKASTEKVEKLNRHYVAFVRGEDGSLWEMDGIRGGPIRRKPRLEEHEDLLTDDILRLCMGGFVDAESDEDTMCSCIALAKDPTEAVTLPLNSLSRGHLMNERSEGVQPRTFWDPAWYGPDHWSQ